MSKFYCIYILSSPSVILALVFLASIVNLVWILLDPFVSIWVATILLGFIFLETIDLFI